MNIDLTLFLKYNYLKCKKKKEIFPFIVYRKLNSYYIFDPRHWLEHNFNRICIRSFFFQIITRLPLLSYFTQNQFIQNAIESVEFYPFYFPYLITIVSIYLFLTKILLHSLRLTTLLLLAWSRLALIHLSNQDWPTPLASNHHSNSSALNYPILLTTHSLLFLRTKSRLQLLFIIRKHIHS